MMIEGNRGPLEPAGTPREVRPTDKARPVDAGKRQTPAQSGETTPPDDGSIHRTDALREAAARLISNGDLDSSQDGLVRPGRVDEARAKYRAGEYTRRDVLARVVDRLIEKWHIS